MNPLQAFANQIILLAWVKCAIEEGVVFINKTTGKPEHNEMTIFSHLEHKTGEFDIPTAEVSPKAMERCLYEVIGNFLINNGMADIQMMLAAGDFKPIIKNTIAKIREKGSKMLRGSPINDKDPTHVARKKHATI